MRLLITGGSRGIGRATALGAAARGWDVAFGYRADHDAAARLVEELRAAGVTAAAVAGDVGEAGDVATLFDHAADALGGLDGVVVNAGTTAPIMPLAQMDPVRIERLIRTNVTGALYCAREAARRLGREGGGGGGDSGGEGGIVLVSSAAARLGSPGEYVDYAASKGAVDTLTLGLSKELAPRGIRVNAVRPGIIETDIHAVSGEPGRAQRLGPGQPMGRAGTADEVAAAILWLLSAEAGYVSGALLDVAGAR